MAPTNEEKVTLKHYCNLRLILWETRDQSGDVILICGNGEDKIKAHKNILVATSKFFAEQFQANNEIKLTDINPIDMELVLEFIYIGQVTILDKNKDNFIITAQKLKIEGAPRAKRLLMPEILTKIFGNLPTEDLMKNVALVSKQFYELTKDFQVPLTCEIAYHKRKDSYIEGMLTRAHQIKKLHLGFLTQASQFTLVSSSMKSMNNLKCLKILGPEGKIILNEALMLFPLKVLFTNQDISKIGNCITLVNVSTAVTTLPEFKALAYLIRLEKLYINLHINAGISIKEIEEVFSHLTQLVNLDVIINLLQISVEHLSAFAKAGPKLKKIKVSAHHLNISLTPDKLNAFFDNNKNIEIFLLDIQIFLCF